MRKIIAGDFYDLVWQQETLFGQADIDSLFRKFAEHGVDAVLWRLSACGKLLYRTATPDQLKAENDNLVGRKCEALLQQYDPPAAAVEAGRKYGVEVYFWLTIYDESDYAIEPNMESSLSQAHPEYSWRSRDGKNYYRGIVSYTYPEVVEFKLRQIREILSYGGDGLYLCNRSHSRSPRIREAMAAIQNPCLETLTQWIRSHGELIVSEYDRCRGEFGFDPAALETYHGDLNDERAWQIHRGKYFLAFMEKTRALNPGKIWFGLRNGRDFGPYIYGNYFFDWEKLTDGSLIDALAYDLQPPNYDKEEDFPEFYKPTKGQKFLWMSLSANNPQGLLDAYAESLERWRPYMDGIILFEAYQMTNNPQYWDFIKYF